jgi:3-methylcrotonyl-CoA carboxylase beta subunit
MKTLEQHKQKNQHKKTIRNLMAQHHQKLDAIKQHNIPLKNPNKLTARSKLKHLVDDVNTILELAPFAGMNLYPDLDLPAAGLITAIASIEGRPCMVFIHDPAIKAGTFFPITVKKYLRAQTIARENKLPCIYVVDSGGAYLPMQADLFADKEGFGRIFQQQAQNAAAGLFQLAIVVGACTAGGAYVPGMADETIMVEGQGKLFLAGPPLVQAATGIQVDAETLGGANMHAAAGTVSHVVPDEPSAYQQARAMIAALPHKKNTEKPPFKAPKNTDLTTLIPSNPREMLDADAVRHGLIDQDSAMPYRPHFGATLKTLFARISGHKVGILINNGVLHTSAANKGADFIHACEQRNVPLIFLQNINGFMVGPDEERQGIIRQGARLVRAIATTPLPKLTVIMGSSYGAGNYAMCGRAFDPRFLWVWPSAKTGIMGGPQAAFVLSKIGSTHQRDTIQKTFAAASDAYYGSARLWDDGVIDPNDTRTILTQALALIAQSQDTA